MIHQYDGTYIGEYRLGGKALYLTCAERFHPKRISHFWRKVRSCTYHSKTVQPWMPAQGRWCEPDAADADDAADVRMLEALALCVGR